MAEEKQLTKQQARLLTLVYKFRFITAPLLAQVLNIRHDTTHKALEPLVTSGLLVKVYEQSWRIDRKPALYYLSKSGVTTVKKLLGLPSNAVSTLYQDHRASEEFINECLTTLACYISLVKQYPDASIRTKTEINRFTIFPKHRPNLYIKAADGEETFVSILPDKLPYFVNKRLDEYLTHMDDEGWQGSYPALLFVLKNDRTRAGFLYTVKVKLEALGLDHSEVNIQATSLANLLGTPNK